jgi:hypothetical protein
VDFTGAPVEVDVGFGEGAPAAPGDRVLTEKGLATVVAIDGDALYIQADSATRLNAGVLRYAGPVAVVRRALALREPAPFLSGDIVAVAQKKYLVREDGSLVKVGDPGEVIPAARVAASGATLVLRADLPGNVELIVGQGMRARFSVSTADFRGKRVFPGDVVVVGERRLEVVGERTKTVWFRDAAANAMVTLQPQALLDTAVVRIAECVDAGLK